MLKRDPSPVAERVYDMGVIHHEINDSNLDLQKQLVVADRLKYYSRIAREYHGVNNDDDFRRYIATSRQAVDWSNPALMMMLEDVPALSEWVKLIPTAAALVPLESPLSAHYPNGKSISAGARDFFINGIDARGVRYRNTLASNLYMERAENHIEKFGVSSKFTSGSFGCGAGNSVLNGLEELRLAYDDKVVAEGLFLDLDRNALKMVKEGARARGVDALVETRLHNVLDPRGIFAPRVARNGDLATSLSINGLRGERENARVFPQFDLIDAIGLAEYLKIEDSGYYRYGREELSRETAGLVTFVRNCYNALKPGGSLLVGNMLYDSRDTTNIETAILTIGWPHIQPRTMEEMGWAFQRAVPNVQVTAHMTQDCVYPIYEIQKPTMSI